MDTLMQRKEISPRDYFAGILKGFQGEEECRHFLKCICSPVELQSMEQRLNVAAFLHKDMTYVQINAETGASTATIGRVKSIIDNDYSLIRKYLSEKSTF